jgi:hypothetical protein
MEPGFVQIEFRQAPHHAHEEQPHVLVLVLIGMNNVAPCIKEPGDSRDIPSGRDSGSTESLNPA